MKKMTPKQFEENVDEILTMNDVDEETTHSLTDHLMEDILISLGYKIGVEKIRNSSRWYA